MPDKLAICGGSPALPEGPPKWPSDDDAIRSALDEVYSDGDWGRYHGKYCQRLSELLKRSHDVHDARLCCSGTIGVELALRALDVRENEEVILGGYDFPGNFRAIEQIGARPVLTDIDRQHGCVSVDTLEQAFSEKTKAAIVSHLHSGMANMPAIMSWAHDRGVQIVEDACQAPGSLIDKRVAGSLGDVGVLSFGGSKLLTSGRGGAVLLNDATQSQRLKVHVDRGNDAYPLSELQAAVLIPQWEMLQQRNGQRQSAVAKLVSALTSTSCLEFVGNQARLNKPSYYKVGWRLAGGIARQEFIAAVQAEGVAIDAGFRGFTRRSEKRCRHAMELPISSLHANSLLILHHPVLLESDKTIERVSRAICKVADGLAKAN